MRFDRINRINKIDIKPFRKDDLEILFILSKK